MATNNSLRARIKLWRRDFDTYARECLKIKTKSGRIVPFQLNRAQKYIFRKLEEQLKETGRVRAIILKARQLGCSTMIAGRFYRRATLYMGVNVFILSHNQDSCESLWGIVERFQTNNPFAPRTGTDNAKELEFAKLDSRYRVSVAGHKPSGRGWTTQLFHGSEVAWWNAADQHFASSIQTVPPERGTEIILESTANGRNNEFYARWVEARSGKSEYQAIFVPWHWDQSYSEEPPDDFKPSGDKEGDAGLSEIDIMRDFGLTPAQIWWRRKKIRELGSVDLFNQEYPLDAEMAFTYSRMDAFISPSSVMRARHADTPPQGPLILGVDPSGHGSDKFVVCGRRGPAVVLMEWRKRLDVSGAVAWLTSIAAKHSPSVIFVDAAGIGQAIISLLREDPRFAGIVRAVNFGGKSQAKVARPGMPGPRNRRAEMYARLKDWLEDDTVQASLPNLDALQNEICSIGVRYYAGGDFILEAKEDIRARLGNSTDLADALVLTFASHSAIRADDTPVGLTTPAKKQDSRKSAVFTPAVTWAEDSWMV